MHFFSQIVHAIAIALGSIIIMTRLRLLYEHWYEYTKGMNPRLRKGMAAVDLGDMIVAGYFIGIYYAIFFDKGIIIYRDAVVLAWEVIRIWGLWSMRHELFARRQRLLQRKHEREGTRHAEL